LQRVLKKIRVSHGASHAYAKTSNELPIALRRYRFQRTSIVANTFPGDHPTPIWTLGAMRRLSLVREHCVALRLAACAASTGTNPPGFGSASAAAAGLSPNAPPAIDGIAGRFKGTVIDSALGSGKAEFQLSQTSPATPAAR
jgi:hypothetical protein